MNTIETDPSNNARVSGGWSRSWTHFKVDRRSPRCCHVTFDHPPINTITATTVAELSDLAGFPPPHTVGTGAPGDCPALIVRQPVKIMA
jgi:hypothetical protein